MGLCNNLSLGCPSAGSGDPQPEAYGHVYVQVINAYQVWPCRKYPCTSAEGDTVYPDEQTGLNDFNGTSGLFVILKQGDGESTDLTIQAKNSSFTLNKETTALNFSFS